MKTRDLRRSMGLCPRCGEKPAGGRVYCISCYVMIRSQPSQAPKTGRRYPCRACGELGHMAKTCAARRSTDAPK